MTAAAVRTSCGTDQLFGVKNSCWGPTVALDKLDKLTATATLPSGACTSNSCINAQTHRLLRVCAFDPI